MNEPVCDSLPNYENPGEWGCWSGYNSKENTSGYNSKENTTHNSFTKKIASGHQSPIL